MSDQAFQRAILTELKRIASALEQDRRPPEVDWQSVEAGVWRQRDNDGWIDPISAASPVALSDLVGIDRQRDRIVSNTRQFLDGLPANNVLLWGARGTGKSSLIRALLRAYAGEGLRVLQVDRDDLLHLPAILTHLAALPYRFIIYSDDLSFERNDANYKRLKSALDGALSSAPDNVLIYATSNRRHLLPEASADNLDVSWVEGELHPGDAIEETISLSDRFGLWISFYPFNQDTYLAAVHHWVDQLATRHGLAYQWNEALQKEAVSFAQARGVRSGRSAWQFACQWVGAAVLKRG